MNSGVGGGQEPRSRSGRATARRRILEALTLCLVAGLAVWVVLQPSGVRRVAADRPPAPQGGIADEPKSATLVGRGGSKDPAPETGATGDAPPSGAGDPGYAISGRVLRADSDEPVGDAVVVSGPAGPRTIALTGAERSRADGYFALTVASRDAVYLRVTANGFKPWSERAPSATARAVTVRLERGASISGTVVDELGRPSAGARVWCHQDRNRTAWPNNGRSLIVGDVSQGGESTSDDRGGFAIDGLDLDASYRVRVAKTLAVQWGDATLVRAGTPALLLHLRVLGRVVLHVVDGTTGTRVEGLRSQAPLPQGAEFCPALRGEDAEAQAYDSAQEGHEGEFRIVEFARGATSPSDSLLESVFEPTLRAPGYEPLTLKIPFRYGNVTRLEVPLPRSGTLSMVRVDFRATFVGGRAFTGLLLLRMHDSSIPLAFVDGLPTGEVSLPAGRHTVRVQGGGPAGRWWESASPPMTIDLIPGSATPTEIRLDLSGGAVALRVIDSRGRSVEGYDLVAVSDGVTNGWTQRWELAARDSRGRTLAPEMRDPVVWLPAGTHEIRVNMPGVGFARVPVRVSADGSETHLDVSLEPGMDLDFAELARRRTLPR